MISSTEARRHNGVKGPDRTPELVRFFNYVESIKYILKKHVTGVKFVFWNTTAEGIFIHSIQGRSGV